MPSAGKAVATASYSIAAGLSARIGGRDSGSSPTPVLKKKPFLAERFSWFSRGRTLLSDSGVLSSSERRLDGSRRILRLALAGSRRRLGSSPTPVLKKKPFLAERFSWFSRGRTRTYDLRVMSPTSCQLLYPASMLRLKYRKRKRMSIDPVQCKGLKRGRTCAGRSSWRPAGGCIPERCPRGRARRRRWTTTAGGPLPG